MSHVWPVLQHVFYVDEMAAVLADLAPTCLHLLVGKNTDSGKPTQMAHFEGISAFTLEQESLFDIITECRVVPPPPPPAPLLPPPPLPLPARQPGWRPWPELLVTCR